METQDTTQQQAMAAAGGITMRQLLEAVVQSCPCSLLSSQFQVDSA